MSILNCLKKGLAYCATVLIGTFDIISSSGIMYYGSRLLFTESDNLNEDLGTSLAIIVATSTATILVLTRPSALWHLFLGSDLSITREFSIKNTNQEIPYALLEDKENSNHISENEIKGSPKTKCSSSKYRQKYCPFFGVVATGCSYLSVVIAGGCLIFVQALGTKAFLKALGIEESHTWISYVTGAGSAIVYFAFVFKGSALNNIKLLTRECLQDTQIKHRMLSSECKHIIPTLGVSFLGALANSMFAFFSLSEVLKDHAITKNLRHCDVLSAIDASAIFYLTFLADVFETHKLFSGAFSNKIPKLTDLSLSRKLVIILGLFMFLINKISIGYIFFASGKYIMVNKINMSNKGSIVLSILSAASATFIQSVFEFPPVLKSLLYKAEPLNNIPIIDNRNKSQSASILQTPPDSVYSPGRFFKKNNINDITINNQTIVITDTNVNPQNLP